MPSAFRIRTITLRYATLATTSAIALANSNNAGAQQASFMGLGDLPGGHFESRATDISADGSIVVGWSVGADGKNDAFRWTRETGIVALGAPTSYNEILISNDGTTIVGNMSGGDFVNFVPYRWTQASGVEALPWYQGTDRWYATAMSGDGSVIAGWTGGNTVNRFHAVKWTTSDGTESLFGSGSHRPDGLSDDAAVILGSIPPGGANPSNWTQLIWTAENGFKSFPQPSVGTWSALSISGDGKVVVGNVFLGGDAFAGSGNHRAGRWTDETGIVVLPPTPDGAIPYCGCGMSPDGAVIVGNAVGGTNPSVYPGSPLGFNYFIWDEIHGSRNLRETLINEYGLGEALAGWKISWGVRFGVSADGRTIFGTGTNPDGRLEAWTAFLGTPVPEPSVSIILALALFTSGLGPIRFRVSNPQPN